MKLSTGCGVLILDESEALADRVLVFATESRLHRGPDGKIWSVSSNDWYDNLSPWLRTFDRFVLIARVDENISSAGRPVEGPRVDVAAVPNYKGPLQLALRYGQVRRAVMAVCSDASAHYGGRFPGVLSGLVLRGALRLQAPVMAHVVGDPRAVLRSGVAGRIGQLVAGLAGSKLRHELKKVDAAIYVSKYQLQAQYPLSSGRLWIGRSDVVLTAESFASSSRHYKPPIREWRLVAVGSHEQMYKGHDLLISSLKRLRAKGLDVTIDIVGSGKYNSRLRQLAHAEGVAEHVHFYGHVASPREVRKILDQADIFIMPSRTEGVPRALIEAMARGLPCLGSNVGAIPELLGPEFLFRGNDIDALTTAIEEAIERPDRLSEQSVKNMELARDVLAETSSEKLDDFLLRFAAISNCPGRSRG